MILIDADIERAAHTLAETAGSPVRAILFGSHARGKARIGSDLDFLVIEPEVPDRTPRRCGAKEPAGPQLTSSSEDDTQTARQ